jgi:hypothetical protein
MFKLSPEVYTVKDVARALHLTPNGVRKSIKRTRSIRGVKVQQSHGMFLFTEKQYNKIVGRS